ncbi:MAG TPA: hypothetical protein VHS09_09335, partial [Polyangiaceae bacterium]|nr:hypothetical protein [Polyangiaceae bacterium]
MSARFERLLLLAAPAAAMATVALGLRIGAGHAVRAAVVYGAPPSGAGTGLAWQVVAFDEERGYREPAPHLELDVLARALDVDAPEGGREARWHGATSDDGAVEMLLPFASPAVHLEVRAGRRLLAAGDAAPPPPMPRIPAGTS